MTARAPLPRHVERARAFWRAWYRTDQPDGDPNLGDAFIGDDDLAELAAEFAAVEASERAAVVARMREMAEHEDPATPWQNKNDKARFLLGIASIIEIEKDALR